MRTLILAVTLVTFLCASMLVHGGPHRRDADSGNPQGQGEPDVEEDKPEIQPPTGNDNGDEDNDNDDNDDNDNNDEDSGRKRRASYTFSYGTSSAAGGDEDDPFSEVYSGPAIIGKGSRGKAGGCSSAYAALPNSTMCFFKDSSTVTNWGFTRAEKSKILDWHNQYRASVNSDSMMLLHYDSKLATLAQKLAQSCHGKHDSNENRQVPDYNINIGQNICIGTNSINACLKRWFFEKKNFVYGGSNQLNQVGHFTQVMNSKVVAIGCGYANCPKNGGPHIICNYHHGQLKSEVNKPYGLGKDCAKCPGFCNQGLCDCNKKICKNGGSIDLQTCGCNCNAPYSGTDCSSVSCPSGEPAFYCGTSPYDLAGCDIYSNMVTLCPSVCGVC